MQRRNNSSIKLLSIIVPAYKQEKTIVKDIKNIQKELQSMKLTFEIIVVVDGVVDNTLKKILRHKSSQIKIIAYHKNQGKGQAIQFGMMHAKGDVIGFLDAGMELNPKGLAILLTNFQENNADIVIGSKRHPQSKIIYPVQRRVISYLSQKFVKLLFGLDVTDTQVGMKFFRKNVIRKVLPRLVVKKFAFDIEILVVAHYMGYTRIFEAPVELKYNFEGSVISQNMLHALFYTLWDVCGIYYRLKIIHSYDLRRSKYSKTVHDFEISVF